MRGRHRLPEHGILDGIKEAKELIGDMMENPIDSIIIYGNSSLNVIYDTTSRSITPTGPDMGLVEKLVA